MAAGCPGVPAALGRSLGELLEEIVQLHTHPPLHGLMLRHRLL